MSSRRDFMETLAALAAARGEPECENQDFIESRNNCGPRDGVYRTGEFTPKLFGMHAWGVVGDLTVDDPFLNEKNLAVNYDLNSVYLVIETEGEDVEAGATVDFDVDQAKKIAVALYQAAEESEGLSEKL